jgi:hypothetical protein
MWAASSISFINLVVFFTDQLISATKWRLPPAMWAACSISFINLLSFSLIS